MRWKSFDPAFDPQGLDPFSLPPVKERKRRRLWFTEELVIKGFRKSLLRSDQALKEAKIGLKLEGLSPRVLAYGRKGVWSLVVTRRVKGKTLSAFLRETYPGLDRREKDSFLEGFSSFLASLIKRGLFQPDFHLENILITPSGGLLVVDFHRARLVKRYDRPLLERQLAHLLPPLLEHLSWWEVGRLCAHLSRKFPLLREKQGRLKISRRAFSLMGKHFQKKSKGIKLSFQFENLFRLKDKVSVFKDSRSIKSGVLEASGQKFFVKIYVARNILHGLFHSLTGTRAKNSFEAAHLLAVRGINTPLPLAFETRRFALSGPKAVLIYPYLEEIRRDWKTWWKDLTEEERDTFVRKTTRFLWEMHEKGIFHGDAKITNFFLRGDELGVFDLDQTRVTTGPIPVHLRLQDLAHLAFSLSLLAEEEKILDEIFSFYRFLCPEIGEKYPTFLRLVQKRLSKRRLKG